MPTIDPVRAAVIAEARTWLGTPYHSGAHVRGAGVDCGQLLIEVFATLGLVPRIDPGYYPGDWHLHRGDERYLAHVQQHAREIEDPQPADIVLMRFGRAFSHGGIFIGDGQMIHSYLRRPCAVADLSEWAGRPRRYFTVFGR